MERAPAAGGETVKNASLNTGNPIPDRSVPWQRGGEPESSDPLRLLIRELVRQSSRPGSSAEPAAAEEKVLLDLEVDGVRCLLVRRALAAHGEVLLSPREWEIARMVARGYPNKVIARVLEISSWTVSTHLRRTFAKLGVSTRASMVARLLEPGAPAGKAG